MRKPSRTTLRHLLADAGKLALSAGLLWMGVDLAQAQAPAPATATATTSTSVARVATAPAGASINAGALYQQHCAACHGSTRTGGMGPALLPESLERVRPAEVLRVIGQGRTATQMPGFAGTLSAAEIQALAQWVRSPVQAAPTWGDEDIRASRVATPVPADEPAKPVWSADPMNLFLVVEGGDHHVSLLDGDKFEVITRFASRYALHGGPKFTPDGRYVFFG